MEIDGQTARKAGMQRPGRSKMTDSNARRGEKKTRSPVAVPLSVIAQDKHEKTDAGLTAAAARSRLNALAATDLYRGLVVGSGCAHPLLDLASHGQEGLLDVAGVLGGRLQEWDAEAVSEFLRKLVNIPADSNIYEAVKRIDSHKAENKGSK